MNRYNLDVRRLLCPLPVIRVAERIKTLKPGERLEVLATDPGVLHDIPAWCRVHGYKICSAQKEDHLIRVEIEVPDLL